MKHVFWPLPPPHCTPLPQHDTCALSGALQIENSEETDQGKYECVASNVEGVRYSSPANLYVRVRRVPPRFSITPISQEIMPGGSVNITCVAVGSPMPYVKWMLNAEDLTPEDEMPVGRNVLVLDSVRESANYTCVAMSSLGIIEAVAQITVKSLPKPPGTPEVTETTATSVTITWDSGNPDPVSYYIIQYRAKSPESKFETMDGITTTRYSIGGLYPNTEYEIRVSAFNTIGQGPPSEPVETRTGEQAPASPPRNVKARIISQNTMMVRWEEPEEPNGQIKGYRVYYTMEDSQPMTHWQIHNVQDSMITTIQSLVPSETYTIKVLAFTSVGDGPFSEPIHVKVLQGVPGQPTKFQVGAVSDTSMELTWEPAYEREGIVSYDLRYKEGSHGIPIKKTFGPTSSYVVDGLRPNTEYYFALAAISNKGLGAFTNDISRRTLQAKPSAPPQDIKCGSSSSTSLLVSWRPPPVESQNGALAGYTVRYQVMVAAGSAESAAIAAAMEETSGEVSVGANEEQVLLQRLEKWTQYRISVAAFTHMGPGPESELLSCRTDEDVPGAPPRRVEVDVLNSTALKVMWRSLAPGKQHGQIRGYQVHYVRVENGESRGLPLIKDVMLADAQEMVIGGLKPDTTYSITVAAYTTKGDGARSKPKLVVTKGAESRGRKVGRRPRRRKVLLESFPRVMGPSHAAAATTAAAAALIPHTDSETSAVVRWDPPDLLNGMDLQGYRLQFGRKDISPLATLEFDPQEHHYSVGSIHRGTTYLFKVSAKSRGGFGEEAVKELRVPEKTPGGYPQITGPSNVTCCSVQLSWSPPVLAERNGAITEYTLAYKEAGAGGAPRELRLGPSLSSFVLNSLKPNSAYDVKIRAHTSVGPGPYSPPMQYRTAAFDPTDVPKNFTVRWATKTTVMVAWKFSESRSPYKCTIEYSRQKMDIDARQLKALVSGLRPNSTYEFRVSCMEGAGADGGGARHRVAARTAPLILAKKPKLDIDLEPDSALTISFPPVESRDIKNFYLVAVPLKRTTGTVKNLMTPDEMDMEELLRDLGPRHRSRRQLAQLDQRKPFIMACFRQLPASYMVGSEHRHSSCENKALDPGQEYVFFLLAELNSTSGKMFATSPYTDTVMTPQVVDQVRQVETGADGLIWVVGPVLAVVFIICIVIAILLYKNRKRKEAEPRTKCMLNNADITPHHPTDPVEMRRINYQTPGMMNHPPIPITELPEHTELLKANDNLKLSQEYESIDPGQQFTWEHSNLEVNKPKNRYANVIAYDHSRVILAPIDGITGSDYINSNYIDGYRKQNAYIATQGPLPETFGDFWRMVWEQRAATVVMMTRLEEKSRHSGGREVGTDHVGVASAGVGRTGCFIVIDAMLERIKHEKTADIYGQVTLMRSQRNYMVQTEDQYSFIHDALLEAVACGNTEVAARSLYSYIQKLAQVEVGEHVTGMELEFKRLANSKAHTSRFISANLPCNKFKNRLVNIMPYETTREKCHQYWPAERSARYQYFVVDPMAEYNMPQYILREFKVTDARDGQSRTVRQFQFTDWPEQGVPKSGEGFIDFIGQVHKTKEQFGQDGPISVHCR
ncbi:hypothetical protein CRUP_018866 [Coryphaenoides rupestris]|nr:hypothetical protein CRUP_018866 [Coryphaenoides rupestris]